MKNHEIIDLSDKIKDIYSDLKEVDVPFAYGLLKNKILIENEIVRIMELFKPTGNVDIFNKEHIKMCEKFCKKDENGLVLKVDGDKTIYDIADDEAFKKAAIKLKKKWDWIFVEENKRRDDFNKFLDEESSLVFNTYNVDKMKFPLSMEVVETLSFMLE